MKYFLELLVGEGRTVLSLLHHGENLHHGCCTVTKAAHPYLLQRGIKRHFLQFGNHELQQALPALPAY